MIEGVAWDDPILGIDPSLSCVGWCALRGDDFESHHFKLGGEHGLRLHTYRRWLRFIVQSVQPALIAIELPFVNHKRPTSTATGYMMNGVAREALEKCLSPVIFVENNHWKKEVLGTSRISTEHKKAGEIVRRLNHLNFDVRQIDEADALGIALSVRKKAFGKLR